MVGVRGTRRLRTMSKKRDHTPARKNSTSRDNKQGIQQVPLKESSGPVLVHPVDLVLDALTSAIRGVVNLPKKEYGEGDLLVEDGRIQCRICGNKPLISHRSSLLEHARSAGHIMNKASLVRRPQRKIIVW